LAGKLRIGEDGTLEVDERTRERLAGREFSLMLGPGNLLLAMEVDRGVAAGSTPMLAGDLGHVTFSAVVSLIAQAGASGVLRISGASGTRRVIFAEGEVRGAYSERVGERLDEVLVRMGLLKPEDAESLGRETTGGGRRVGRLAVEHGLLSERDLWNAIQEHVITVFQAILLEPHGSFLLADESVLDATTVPGLSAEALLMEGARRLDELRRGANGSAERVAEAFGRAFRDLFTTAEGAGAGAAVRGAARSVFDDDPDPLRAGAFAGVAFSEAGGLPEDELVRRATEAGARDGRPAQDILHASLKTVLLFLLYVAGEHLPSGAQQALHARVKLLVSRD